MLKHLTLKNFLLVDALDIGFDAGLTTITGESGAGKSILLNALGLLLGDRAHPDTIRPGKDKADVVAEFDLSQLPHLAARLTTDELEGDEAGQCLIRRIVGPGRSRAFINGIPVTTQYLRSLGEGLVEIYGQNEHMRLADRNLQLAMLDAYAGQQAQVSKVRATYQAWQATLARLAELKARQTAANDRRELLAYQLKELQELALNDGEYESLELEQRRLAHAHKTLEILHFAEQSLEQLDELRSGASELDRIDDTHKTLASAQANLRDALSLLDDAAHDIRHYKDQVTVDPAALEEIDDRLSALLSLARKHKIEPGALHELTEDLALELNNMSADDAALVETEAAVEVEHQAFLDAAKKLSKARKKAAPKFAREVSGYMAKLGIGDGKFEVVFSEAEHEGGIDRVQFNVTTNPSFPSGPLQQIASGGEQTRISLSIQLVAAATSELPCLILDEADVGVGGTTADTVGRILRDLGDHTQVICITHAPQVAALGNYHLCVQKRGNQTEILALDDAQRTAELARMLAGADITDKTMDYAASLLAAGQGAATAEAAAEA